MFKNKNLIWLLVFIVFIFLIWLWQNKKINDIWHSANWSVASRVMDWQTNSVDVLQNIVAEVGSSAAPMTEIIKTPAPLRNDLKNKTSDLVASRVIFHTNQARLQYQLPLLQENVLLQQAAQKKLSDMISKQYFDHVSPQGVTTGELIGSVGYKFIAVGENLALGGYRDEADLVEAWLDSPGHRENILSANYTEIGVAVVYAEFEGEMTWLAVQEFGRPTSDCPIVDQSLKNQINNEQIILDAKGVELENKQAELSATKPKANASREEVTTYNQQVEEYNNLVASYKLLAEKLKQQVQTYNQQVEQFNLCLKNTNY